MNKSFKFTVIYPKELVGMITEISHSPENRAIDIVCHNPYPTGEYGVLSLPDELMKVPIAYRRIYYVSATSAGCELVTDHGTHQLSIGLKQLFEHLDPEVFAYIHRSKIIRISAMKEYAYQQVRMQNGDVLPIGKSYRKECHRRFGEPM
jgi:DNA-binding LytR/AlgR family response regulator